MCGIGAVIGNISEDKLRLLAILNESRGAHSTGIFAERKDTKQGIIYKNTVRASEFIKEKQVSKLISDGLGIAVLHTRFATHGNISVDNSHPFHIGNIVLVHNGIVYNHRQLNEKNKTNHQVDSVVIAEQLNLYGAKGLSALEGYWGLAWYDLRQPHNLFLSRFNNDLAVIKTKNAIYISSDIDHLKAAGISGKRINLEEKTIYRLDMNLVIHKEETYNPIERQVSQFDISRTKGTYSKKPIKQTYDDLNYWSGLYPEKDLPEFVEELCDCCSNIFVARPEEINYYSESILCPDCAKTFAKEGCLL